MIKKYKRGEAKITKEEIKYTLDNLDKMLFQKIKEHVSTSLYKYMKLFTEDLFWTHLIKAKQYLIIPKFTYTSEYIILYYPCYRLFKRTHYIVIVLSIKNKAFLMSYVITYKINTKKFFNPNSIEIDDIKKICIITDRVSKLITQYKQRRIPKLKEETQVSL